MSDRIESFVAALAIAPDARVLEIGCGHGIAASLVCRRLAGGRYTAIDRSQKMILAARARNREFVDRGVAEFLHGALETAELGPRRFDVVIAMRVRLFHTEPDRAAAFVRRWLAPDGRLFVQYDEPASARPARPAEWHGACGAARPGRRA